MASNSHTIADEDGDYSDWLEIYNADSIPVNLAGFHLSDKINQLDKWGFPNTVIAPNDFLVVFASGKDRNEAGNELHTNFSIGASGEDLLLSHEGNVLHYIPEIELGVDKSFGFLEDGTGSMSKFITSTPGASNEGNHALVELSVNNPGGIYTDTISVIFSASDTAVTIQYTTDGTTPTSESFHFDEPLVINESLFSTAQIHQKQISPSDYYYPENEDDVPRTVVLRAAAFNSAGIRVSEVLTHTYLSSDSDSTTPGLPIVSICADHDDLFDEAYGIFVPGIHWNDDEPEWSGNYYQRGREWERPIHIEFYDSVGTTGLRMNGGLRTHGQSSRRFTQKGMRLYARKSYGTDRFNYNLFPDKFPISHKRLVLKPFLASWNNTGIEDYVGQKIAKSLNLDYQGSRPVVVYLNGEYWGLYFLLERIDHRYLQDNHILNPDHIHLISGWSGQTTHGNSDDFIDLMGFIDYHDLSKAENYEHVATRIDIDNFIHYQLVQIFISNYDWPANNMRCWRNHETDAKWRWIFFDGDAGFGDCRFNHIDHALNTSDQFWPSNAQSTLILRKLLTNHHFTIRFFDRLEELLENQFAFENTDAHHEDVFEQLNGEMDRQSARFGRPASDDHWISEVASHVSFLSCRPCELVEQTANTVGRVLKVDGCDTPAKPNSDLWIELYPNPNFGQFSLYYHSEESGDIQLQIHDITGRHLTTLATQVHDGNNYISLDLPALPNGLLLLTIQSPEGKSLLRFVKL